MMSAEHLLNEEDTQVKIKRLEDAIQERDNKLEELSDVLETTRTLCQEHRRSNKVLHEVLNEVVIKLQAIRTGVKLVRSNETQNITDYLLGLVDKTSLTITDRKS